MKAFGWLAAFGGVSFVLYMLAFPSLTISYRLTLEAVVDGQPKTGAAVIEVTYSKQSRFAGQHDLIVSSRGKAAVLDLGPPGVVFALLKAGSDSRSSPGSIVFRAFDFSGGAFPGSTVEDGLAQIRKLSGKRELTLTSLPLLVRFRDLNDPKTVEKVDPLDIGKGFGVDAKLVRVTLEIVPTGRWPFNSWGLSGEPITANVEERLPWLAGMMSNIDGTHVTDSNRLSNTLNSYDFRRL